MLRGEGEIAKVVYVVLLAVLDDVSLGKLTSSKNANSTTYTTFAISPSPLNIS